MPKNLPRFICFILLLTALVSPIFENRTVRAFNLKEESFLPTALTLTPQFSAGLADLVGGVSPDNILKDIKGLNQYSRCLNSPGHEPATSYIVEKLKSFNLTPVVQSFSSLADGVRKPQLANIIVRFAGTNPHNTHLVTAHYDSSPVRTFPPQCDSFAPGANDNASGTAVLLEMARLLENGPYKFQDDLELVFFDGEEFGFLGSLYFLQNFDNSRTLNPGGLELGGVINMDMVGYNSGKSGGKVWAVAQPGESFNLAKYTQSVAGNFLPSNRLGVYTLGDLFPASQDPNRLSDQQAFWQAKKGTAILLTEDVSDAFGADPRYHTPGDTLFNQDGTLRLDPTLLSDTTKTALATVGSLAGPIPARFFPEINPAFEANWGRSDRLLIIPTSSGQAVGRSWVWGPQPNKTLDEAYQEAPGGSRKVTYFDKARMEYRLPGTYVTNGLLVKELASGMLQLGDTKFSFRTPAPVPVAGDPNQQGQNPNAPTYASFKTQVEAEAAPNLSGSPVYAFLDKDGTAGRGPNPGDLVRNAIYIPNTGHNIPDVFWNWFQLQGITYNSSTDSYNNNLIFNWIDTVGYPITEAFWVHTRISGIDQTVLVQLFERRVLTFNPANSPAFKVEMGNVGQHYYSWRYGEPAN